MNVWQFILDPQNDFLGHTWDYLRICGISTLTAFVLGLFLGIIISLNSALAFIIVNLSGLLRAVPVIVFLIAALPILRTGDNPAILALIILGIPPILLNTYEGIRSIDPALIDAARGMGMTFWQIMRRILMPLVFPVVAAGVRTSAVQIIATATLAAFIGAGGYGLYIVDGVFRFDDTKILAGAIPVAILALLAEIGMSWLQFSITPKGLRKQDAYIERTV